MNFSRTHNIYCSTRLYENPEKPFSRSNRREGVSGQRVAERIYRGILSNHPLKYIFVPNISFYD